MAMIEKTNIEEYGWLNSNSRSKSAKRNILVSLLAQPLTLILTFIVRTFFIKYLGQQYLGLNGLYTNLLSFLSFAELGIGVAIAAALYQPVAEKDVKTINSLMIFFKKIYRIIGGIIFIGGIILTLLLPIFIKGKMPANAQLGFILFFMNSVSSYFLVTNRTLLAADQRQYLNVLNQFLFSLAQQIVQVLILVYLQSFVLYLVVQIISTILSNLWISIIVKKNYPFLNYKTKERVPDDTLHRMKNNIFGMMSAKFGGIVLTGTDNIILSTFIGLSIVGKYSNYMLIINGATVVLGAVLGGITATIGNLKADKDKYKAEKYFNNLFDANTLFILLISICLALFLVPFIKIWAGDQYVFSWIISALITFTFFTNQLRQVGISYIVAYELFGFLKIKSIIEACTNLILSLCFVLFLRLGIVGVLIGTLLSNLLVNYYWESRIVTRYALDINTSNQMKKMVMRTVIAFILIFTLSYLSSKIDSILKYQMTWFVDSIIFVSISGILIIVSLYRNLSLRNLLLRRFLRN